MFGTCKRVSVTAFKPGVLTRAYGKRSTASLKIRMISGNAYYRRCLHALYPDRVDSRGAKIPKTKRIPYAGVYLKVLLERLDPVELHMPPDDKQLHIFIAWAYKFQQKSGNSNGLSTPGYVASPAPIARMLKVLSAHEAYTGVLYPEPTTDAFSFFKAFQARLLARFGTLGPYKKTIAHNIQVFEGQLGRLKHLSGVNDTLRCGDLSLCDAAVYCTLCQGSQDQLVRLNLLMHTGFRQSEEALLKRMDEVHNYRQRVSFMRKCCGSQNSRDLTLQDYMNLAEILKIDPVNCAVLTADEIYVRLVAAPPKSRSKQVLRILDTELRAQHAEGTADILRNRLDPKVVGKSNWESFCDISPWHAKVLQDALQAYSTNNKTWYSERFQRSRRTKIARYAYYVRDFARYILTERNQKVSEPFRWFVDNASSDLLQELLAYCARNVTCCNQRVRSALEAHHAAPQVRGLYSFLKLGLAAYIPPNHLTSICLNKILRSVANKRIPADPMVRRTFLDSELDSMMTACQHDCRMQLMFLLLREIGLRCGSLCHMQYYTLVDSSHEPRHICQAKEKGRSVRIFVTSDKLKRAIRDYYALLATQISDLCPEQRSATYIFGVKDLTKPLSDSTLRSQMQSVADAAGITDVRVHPHAFRHTIVGQLIDAGNSMEIVSKYIGHKSVDVTSNHYWVANIQELSDSIKNPVTGAFQEQVRKDEIQTLEMQLLRKKKDKCMEIIHRYNLIIASVERAEGSAEEVRRQIFESMPDLGEVLRVINEDEMLEGDDDEEDEEKACNVQDDIFSVCSGG